MKPSASKDIPDPCGGPAGKKECLRTRIIPRLQPASALVSAASLRAERYARTTVYPCDACHGVSTPYLVRSKRTGRL